MKLTDEQAHAITCFQWHQPVRIVAYAGAGKTSTLVKMAESSPRRRGVYMAFNKSIAAEAIGKFPRSVMCKTAHALAFRAVSASGYTDEKMTKRLFSRDLKIPHGDLPSWVRGVKVPGEFSLNEQTYKSLLISTLTKFMQSGDEWPDETHAARVARLMADDMAEIREEYEVAVSRAARRIWADMCNKSSAVPLGHDGYLKMWSLTRPKMPADFLMVDEAQDLNGVLLSVIDAQDCQIVSVGDSHQQIYAWRGAIDALKRLPGCECRLTQSFRFGPEIAEFANRLLVAMGETVPLTGRPDIDDRVKINGYVGDSDAVLCRTNSGVMGVAIEAQDSGRNVYVPGGTAELRALVQDAQDLKAGRPARSAELLGFSNFHEVVQFAQSDEGQSLRAFVSLVVKYGCGRLLGAIDLLLANPMDGCLTVSTAHKAKRLEWKSVELHDDFAVDEDVGMGERRLFYVAATRAQRELIVSGMVAEPYVEPCSE
jgi:superfamily I DNA/RNA helicase